MTTRKITEPRRPLCLAHGALRFLIVVVGLLSSVNPVSADPKISKDVPRSSGTVDVIIQYRSAPTTGQLQQLAASGGELKKIHDSIKAVSVKMPTQAISALGNDPTITYVSYDRKVKGALDVVTATVNANFAWQL